MLPLGVTTMSAGQKLNRDGYAEDTQQELEQFEISDERSVDHVAQAWWNVVFKWFGKIGITLFGMMH